MNRWNSSLRPFALLAALAALSLPARADTLFYGGDNPWTVPTEYNGVAAEWPFEIYRGDASSAAPQQIKATSSNPAVALVRAESRPNAGSSATVTLFKDPQTDATRPTYVATFYLVPQAAGNATITVQMTTDSSTPDISFDVVVTGSSATRRITFPDYPDRNVIMPEANSRLVQFRLGSDVPTATAFQITCDKTDYDGKVSFPATVSVPSGNSGTFTVYGLDGSYSCGLTITDPNGNYDNALLNLMVTNVPPRILASTDPENPTPWGATVFKNQSVPFPVAAVGATDSASDQDNLTYRWSFAGSSTTDPNAVFTNSWSSPTPDGGFSLVYITVSDGDASTVGYYSVVVQDSVTLYTDTTSDWAGLTKNGGIAQDTTFRIVNPVGIDWASYGVRQGKSEVGPRTSISLRAELEEGTYPFGWLGDAEYLRAPNAMRVPSPNLTAIVTMPDEGDATVKYFASYPYYHTVPGKGSIHGLNPVWTDPFGDFDGDGLSDTFEDYWFQDGMEATSDQVTSLPVGIPTGEYGPSGNLDDDWLPTTAFEPAPDEEDPAIGKIGWPVVVDDGAGGAATNRVRVYKYPLDFSTGGESYNKGAYAEKPLFGNFIEYRGLAEDRTGGPGNDPSVFVYYAPELVGAGARGNCPGTDPTVADTDGDAFSDGWEFYFWSTILYGVHTENWRAWDPTYSLYRTASASAGIPLLHTDDPLSFTFTIDPTPGYVIDPATGEVRTTYEVDKDVIKENKLVMPIRAGSVSIEFDGTGFALYTLAGRLTSDGRDALFYQQWADTDDDGVVDTAAVDSEGNPIYAPLTTAWVDALSGEMHVPGWDVLKDIADASPDVASIGMDTPATITYLRLDGILDKSFLLSRFDPNSNYYDSYRSLSGLVKSLGLDEKKWDPSTDLDGDGLLDYEEYVIGTDPLHWDTDRDGMPDGWEVQRGLNPLSPLNGDGTGPRDNPDEDYMATAVATTYDRARNQTVSTTSKHIYAYLTDLSNRTYWNGSSYVGFVPGKAATTGDGYSNLEEFLYSWYGIQSGLWFDAWRLPFMPPVYGDKYYKGIYPVDWPDTTTNPCDNDTNRNGVPDGWEAYVGWNPIDGALVTPLTVPPPDEVDTDLDGMAWNVEFASVEVTNRWPETRTVFIGPGSSYTTTTTASVDASGATNSATSVTGSGTEVTIRGFGWPASLSGWTNKRLPTDPWNADTDGDGIGDLLEYSDDGDRNKDDVEFCNFDPCSVDTDLDWLPDNWEWYMGTYTPAQARGVSKTDPFGPYGDPDGDGLPNYQEYLTAANYGWRHDVWYRLDNQKIWVPQKRFDLDDKYGLLGGDWPYDPGLFPTMGPVVKAHQYDPMDFFSIPESTDAISEGLVALRNLEKSWSVSVAESPSIQLETVAALYQRLTEIVKNPFDNGPDGPSKFMDDTRPSVDPIYNTDVVDIPGKKYFQYHTIEQHRAIVAAYEGLLGHLYSYGQKAYGSWDPAYLNTPSGVLFTYIPLNDNLVASGFPGTRPLEIDSDHDDMSDYWEIYHGLNPAYGGGLSIPTKAGGVADADWDGADNWLMGNDPAHVLNLHLVPPFEPVSRGGHVWYPNYPSKMVSASFADGEPTAFNGIMERAHYDLVNRPWLTGDPSADCDHDGLSNQEESYSFFANDLLSHTDPTPYWMTDITQTYAAFGQKASHVNLYYTTGSIGASYYWWWEYPYTENDLCTGSPTYLWDFEVNEGYDTDNDNISDREEMTDLSTRGKSDPSDLDSPMARKAMYFDGHAALRTQRPFFHDQYALASFTAEFWVRPKELPAPGRIATLLQRPVMMPVDVISGSRAWAVRNTFFVYLDEDGAVHAEVDNDGIEQPANQATVTSTGRLVPGVWTHVAVVMDSRNDRLTLYLDGKHSAHVSTSLKPCTGTIMDTSYQSWTTDDGSASGIQTVSTTTVSFSYSPAPIVVGAYDTTPWSVVGLNPDAVFDENRFFKGWIDEIRIWDRCRTESEIVNNRMKRFTKADIEPINQARFAWDMEHLYATNAEDDFPQKLLYHYSFDNLPDVVPAADRGSAPVFSTDTDALPNGWDQISATRPVPFVPWWYATKNRSTAYSGDLSYVPFVENTVSHLPQRPPRDIKEIVPIYDESWNLVGYRYRLSADWNEQQDASVMTGDTIVGDIGYQYESSGGQDIILPSRLNNTMDPYGDTYATGVAASTEVYPWNFGGMLDLYGVYEGTPIHSDMVPLLDAVADIDVPMWDGFGRGSDVSALDSDGDGLPDWWEIAHGLDPNDATGESGAYGDIDGDGLDNYAEYLAGTDPRFEDSNSDGYGDYFSRADGQSLTYGELYDDGDGMDNAWELENGLDPDLYDAHLDKDHDGWTNWEEYMAGTDPQNASSFPNPNLRITFHYDGVASNTAVIGVYTYGERIGGDTMGGSYDGKYIIADHFRYGAALLGQDGVARIGGYDRAVTYFPYGHVSEASITYMDAEGNAVGPVALDHSNPEYGMFVSDMEGSIGLEYESGTVFAGGAYVGRRFQLDVTIDGHSFPFTEERMLRTSNTHVIGGWNRLFGFIDTNSSGEFEIGEPAGLSIPRPVQIGWDVADAEIPLTDELYGFPRFSWPASTNENVNAYKVYIWNGSGGSVLRKDDGSVVNGIVIKAPRTFIHEGDYIRHGIYGVDGGTAATDVLSWTVASDNGIAEEIIAEGTFVSSSVPNVGPRRTMTALSPVSGANVNGAVVELSWQMDWRNAGVNVTIEKLDAPNAGVKFIDNLCVPLPVRHGKVDSEGYYFTCKPQLEVGKSFVELPSGTYRYTIKERPRNTAVAAQSITGQFTLVNDDSGRGTYSINGTVKYFGKLMESTAVATLGTAAAGAETFSATIPAASLASVVPGAMSIRLANGSDVVCSFSDIGGRGSLSVDGVEESDGWSGSIDYETGAVFVRFAAPLSGACTVSLVKRTFPSSVPLYVRAYEVPETATSSVSLSGPCASQTRLTSKGPFSVTGLKRGTYAVHAFLDSNGNGYADEWETQGFGVLSGTDSPNLDAKAAPLVVDTELRGILIVLHDRDTDNDLLPDAWEWWKFGNLATSGYDQKSAGVYVWEEYADGVLDSDPRTPDTDLDGLTDAMEIKVTRTDTHRRDTDGDGIGDLEEFLSGSDPLDPNDARPFSTPALAFDADGVPYVECAYPSLVPGVVLTYTLQRKLDLAAPAWEDVAELEVAATDAATVALADGVMSSAKPAGTAVMKPADQADIDYRAGFFRIRVSADYGKMVDNEDGTCSYMTWMPDSAGVWSWTEAARGTGTLVRDADGTWSFVSDATGRTATLVRDENGNWTFQE